MSKVAQYRGMAWKSQGLMWPEQDPDTGSKRVNENHV